MRNLTIKREKTFVGSLGTLKIYIEDPNAGDTTINDTVCRKLGDLKNGEEKTFPVEDRAAKLFVIADQQGLLLRVLRSAGGNGGHHPHG